MNLEYFIAKKVASSTKNSFSSKIIGIAILAITISMAVMIIATALVAGFKNEISEKIFGFWGHIHITHFQSESAVESYPISTHQSFYAKGNDPDVSVDDITNIGQITYKKEWPRLSRWLERPVETTAKTKGGIRHIQVFANKAGIIKTNNEVLEGIILKGVSNDYDWEFFRKYLIEGDILDLENKEMSREILISESSAKRLEVKLGDKFRVNFVENGVQIIRTFKVKGIYNTGLAEYDKKFALVDIRQIQRLNSWDQDQVSGFEVFIDHIQDMDPLGKYVYYNVLGPELYSSTIKDIYPGIFSWLNLQDVNVRVILSLMMIVAIINMITALLILILERTNMIGILKALGSPNWSIRKIFLYQAAFIIGVGMLLGNILGLLFCFVQKNYGLITLPEEAYYVSVAPIEISWMAVIVINIMTIVITLLVLLIPTYLVTYIQPVKAIRFK